MLMERFLRWIDGNRYRLVLLLAAHTILFLLIVIAAVWYGSNSKNNNTVPPKPVPDRFVPRPQPPALYEPMTANNGGQQRRPYAYGDQAIRARRFAMCPEFYRNRRQPSVSSARVIYI